jgi:tetratricopeptide (TPR) repeat protein
VRKNTFQYSFLLACFTLTINAFAFNAKQPSNKLEQAIKSLTQAVLDRDTQYISHNFDIDRLLDKAFQRVKVSDKFETNFRRGFKNNATKKIGAMLLQHVQPDSLIKRLDSQTNQNSANVAFRFDLGDSGYSYVRFILEKHSENKTINIVDWYDYSKGQSYSETLATLITSVAPKQGFLGKLEDFTSNKSDKRKLTFTLTNKLKAKDYSAIESIYQQQKEIISDDWILISMVVSASSMSGNEAFYKAVLADIAKNFQHDERAAFVLLDYYTYAENYPLAIKQMEKLSNQFANLDAAMEHLIASIYYIQSKYEPAIQYAKKSISIEPDFEDAYWTLVSIYVEKKEFSSSVEYLKLLEQNFGYEFSPQSFSDNEFYTTFLQSQAFQEWLM